MITHCLECDTYFRVSAEQLKTANGQVKCGCCMTVFNALESLLDNSESAKNSDSSDAHYEEPMGSALLGTNKDFSNQIEEAIETEEDFLEEAEVKEFPEVISEATTETTENDINEEDEFEEILLTTDVASDNQISLYEETENLTVGNDEDNIADGPLFGITIEEEMVELNDLHEPQRRSSWMWVVASVLMIAALIYQFVNFNTESMLEKFPELESFCSFLDCPVAKELQDVSTINLISRDVREHPQFVDILLINATLINSAEIRKPFPKLQLDLYDKVGRSIGHRQFEPEEYLDSSIDLDIGMRPELPVHIVLEVVGSSNVANSFEFTFLQ